MKQYIAPRAEVTRIEAMQMMAISILNNGDLGLDISTLQESGGDGNQLVNGQVWDDSNDW